MVSLAARVRDQVGVKARRQAIGRVRKRGNESKEAGECVPIVLRVVGHMCVRVYVHAAGNVCICVHA